jgi:hypothetical protein
MKSEQDKGIQSLKDAVFTVLEGFTLPYDVRKILEGACYKAEPVPNCTRSHPHENMDAMRELRTEIARLTNENARLKAAQSTPVQEWMKPHPKCDESCLSQCTKGFTQFPECTTTPKSEFVGTVINSGYGYKVIGFATGKLSNIPAGTRCYVTVAK